MWALGPVIVTLMYPIPLGVEYESPGASLYDVYDPCVDALLWIYRLLFVVVVG